jgi:hypothetical protein
LILSLPSLSCATSLSCTKILKKILFIK